MMKEIILNVFFSVLIFLIIDQIQAQDTTELAFLSTDSVPNVSEAGTNCNCSSIGSNSTTECDSTTKQCQCRNANIIGLNCDKCKLNYFDLQAGCTECDICYQIVELGVDFYKKQLDNLTDFVNQIENNPEIIKDPAFEKKLLELRKQVDGMLRQAETAQGIEATLLVQLENLLDRLKKIDGIAQAIDKNLQSAKPNLDQGRENITIAEDLLKRIRNEADKADRYISIEGALALERAKARADKLGQQSKKMSEMAKESRKLADQHEFDAANIRDLASLALNHTNLAYELAKNATTVQEANAKNILHIKQHIEKATELLNKTKKMTADATAEARRSYEEALALYTLINSLQVSRADIPRLMERALELIQNAKRLKAEIQDFINRHADLLNSTQFKLNEMRALLAEAMRQQQITDAQLADIDKSIFNAKEAIKNAEKTLKYAQDTLEILKKFDQMVQESQKEAKEALKKIPGIQKTISDAENKTKDAADKLASALADATEARNVAQRAYALASETSADVRKLRLEAQELKNRLILLKTETEKLAENMNQTAADMDKYELVAKNDGEIALLILEKAHQAAAAARNATETARKLLNVVNPLIKAIDKIEGIDINRLAQLEEELAKLKQKLLDSNLGPLIDDLLAQLEIQKNLMKYYQDLIDWLVKEVANVRGIRDSLPDKCFKRERLEPPMIENK